MTKKTRQIPEILFPKDSLFAKRFSALAHPLAENARKLLCISDYAARRINNLESLLREDSCQLLLAREDYFSLIEMINLDDSPQIFAKNLRCFRHKHLLRLMLREMAGIANTKETMLSWSHCADAIILHTLKFSENRLSKQYGMHSKDLRHVEQSETSPDRGIVPVSEIPRCTRDDVQSIRDDGQILQFLSKNNLVSKLHVIAMGKLGGLELNFSSDIDLIFAYRESSLDLSISNEQYYIKVVQEFVQLLQSITEDGFVFRVDLRLRPNGDSGPLVCSLTAMETYYQEQGREWERYAMVKARPINEDNINEPWFKELITPFVYRRYVDFSVLESLRSMKEIIEHEVKLNPMLDDIKRGQGGIREVEFIIQCFQLVRGGRRPMLQQQSAMAALDALREEDLLRHTAVLKHGYLFLRKLENAIQMQNDQQKHLLPSDDLKKIQLVIAMEYDNWENLLSTLHQYQRIIHRIFNRLLAKPDIYHDEKLKLANQFLSLWQGNIETKMAVNFLASLNFKEAARCYEIIHAFRNSARFRRLSQSSRLRLERFMVLLLDLLKSIPNTDVVLTEILRLLENIVTRSAYLALLTENPLVTEELLYLFSNSPFIRSLVVNHPFLLELLIDENRDFKPTTKKELIKLLDLKLAHCTDREMIDDLLRQFKLTCWLKAARAELYNQYDAIEIGKYLALVAEVIVLKVLDRAITQLSTHNPEINNLKSHFAIIAYGKLGSYELNYDSDLDLVFLYSLTEVDEGLVTRLTQKILHLLTMRLQSGILYSVDTRLRPSGSAGLLVSNLNAFINYQENHAWTWEHQAFLRARVLYAHDSLKLALSTLKRNIIFKSRDRNKLRDEVKDMRLKIDQHTDINPIKHNVGGLLDLEFLVQFLLLANPLDLIIKNTNTLSQLELLLKAKVISDEQFLKLKSAYCYFHLALHQQLLKNHVDEGKEHYANVLAISEKLFAK